MVLWFLRDTTTVGVGECENEFQRNITPFMEVNKLKRKMLIGQALLITMMLLTSSDANQSLECYSDNINTITCVWNSSSVGDRLHVKPGIKCFLEGILYFLKDDGINYVKDTVKSDLEHLEDSNLYKGTLEFSGEALTECEPTLPVSVKCGNQTKAYIRDFDPGRNIKLLPPEQLQVNGANVSWMLAAKRSGLVEGRCSFELQYRLHEEHMNEETWKDTDIVPISADSCLLPQEKLFLGKQYVVRVRSKYKFSSHWSDWTQTVKWTSTVGRPVRTLQAPEFPGWINVNGTTLAIIVITVLLLLFCILPIVRSLKKLYILYSRKEYSDSPNSVHLWDFKAWLGPFMTPELFIKADSEIISPVEVHDSPTSDDLYCKKGSGDQKSKRERSTSSFSNSMYFLSQSSKCKMENRQESVLLQCSRGPGEGSITEGRVLVVTDVLCINDTDTESGMSSPLETSSSYKHLQKLRLDVQSPDSGFAPEGEDQDSHEESGSEDLPSPPVVDDTLTIRHILPCPVPLEPQLDTFPHPLMPPRLAWDTQQLEMPPPCITTNTLMSDFDLMACSGTLEPSSGDYMCV
ncbi:uncharacterized protein LOC113579429 isoform X2 [Electrophorus electricus]|uniref:uncharacterized protein LOC113579429 isoform X2 n=1 Tax=Electrophorus electricus TaxID=8005 RepID=UPI0015D060E7|nr:uncharacterized protein LOC113579429 isoform X2 [Electrophorus electricus]